MSDAPQGPASSGPVEPNQRPSSSNANREPNNRPSPLGPWIVGAVALSILVMILVSPGSGPTGTAVSYDFFWKQAVAKNVAQVMFKGSILEGKWKQPPANPEEADKTLKPEFFVALPLPEDPSLLELLRNDPECRIKTEVSQVSPVAMVFGWGLLNSLVFVGTMLLVFWLVFRRAGDPMSSGMMGNFVRSPARKFKPSDQQTTFEDVAAMEHAKSELMEIVEFLRNPEKFQKLGAQIPKGVLLMGPPGTGKTLLARATAGEAGVPFFSINGSEFIQMFVGVGASRVRDLFKTAKEQAPCILFIDEIDAVGRIRGAGLGGGHDEREQTLNQILSEMDGFSQTEAVIVVAATNRPDVLDPALLRPGRFDRHVTVERPTRPGREAILKVHCRKVPLADDVDLTTLAAGTIGFSGAELKNLVNEAALCAARAGRDQVLPADFDYARDKVLMGPQREDLLTPLERDMTAYHEAGHALLAWLLPDIDPLHRVTIIPRGRALGVTQLLPNEDHHSVGERRLHSMLAFMLGGRAAEKLIFDEYTAGAEDDLRRATGIARRMVSRWGMSEVIGPTAFRDGEDQPFLGKEIMHEQREFSDDTARLIDREVQAFLQQAADRARKMLEEHRDKLQRLAEGLLKDEDLSQPEMVALIGEPVPRSPAVAAVTKAS